MAKQHSPNRHKEGPCHFPCLAAMCCNGPPPGCLQLFSLAVGVSQHPCGLVVVAVAVAVAVSRLASDNGYTGWIHFRPSIPIPRYAVVDVKRVAPVSYRWSRLPPKGREKAADALIVCLQSLLCKARSSVAISARCQSQGIADRRRSVWRARNAGRRLHAVISSSPLRPTRTLNTLDSRHVATSNTMETHHGC